MIDKLKVIQDEIREQYLAEDGMPWVIGYSGGKDSSMLLQIVLQVVLKLKPGERKKEIHVLSNDTLVENPFVSRFLDDSLGKLAGFSKKYRLPVTVVKTTPKLEDTFWVNLIGKGYPSPNRWFRWCTERMKIDPTSTYILGQVDKFGKVVILLGARKEESLSRAQVMEKYEIKGQRLRKHSTLVNAFVFTPIAEITTDEVWQYLLQVKSPWGADNSWLMGMYRNASGGDCPLVVDTSTPACGNSRFGCWTCTVVDNDKSMEGLVDSGEEWMYPLLEYRNWLKEIRDNLDLRYNKRRNGASGPGPFKLDTRKSILEKLLQTQELVSAESGNQISLISNEELSAIQVHWEYDRIRYAYTGHLSVKQIFMENSKGGELVMEEEREIRKQHDEELLREIAREKGLDPNLIFEMLNVEQIKTSLDRRHNLYVELEEKIEQYLTASGDGHAAEITKAA